MISKEEFITRAEREIIPLFDVVAAEKQIPLLPFAFIGILLILILKSLFKDIPVTLIEFAIYGICGYAFWKNFIANGKEVKKRLANAVLEQFKLSTILPDQIPCCSILGLSNYNLSRQIQNADCFYSVDKNHPFYVIEMRKVSFYNAFYNRKVPDREPFDDTIPVICFHYAKAQEVEILISSNLKIMNKRIDISLNTPVGNMQKVEFEDIEFNKRFTVYTIDQITARSIITPAFIEKLKKLEDTAKYSVYDPRTKKEEERKCKVHILIKRGFLILALDTAGKDMFEFYNICNGSQSKSREIKKQDDFRILAQFYDEINALFEFEKILKLN